MDITNTIKNLNKHNIGGYHVTSKKELFDLLESFLSYGETIGCGDSVTLEELGVFDYIRTNDYNFLDKYEGGLTSDDKREIYLDNFRSDTFFSGVNAISEDGKLFFIDGNGSRVAPIIYGPKQVVLITGTNKIMKDEESALHRVRQVAAPLDTIRLGKKTPCAVTKQCTDCNSPQRICNDFVMIAGQFQKERIKVIIIDGDFGY